jgi:hypothetical protein
MVHKLVTIFAGHLDSFIVINNQPTFLSTAGTSGSGQISVQMTLIQFAGTMQKLRHTCLAPGQLPWPNGTLDLPVASPGNVYAPCCRAVVRHFIETN